MNSLNLFYLFRLSTSKAIQTTTIGAKQRAKEGYYSGYLLSSERERDEQFQIMINDIATDDHNVTSHAATDGHNITSHLAIDDSSITSHHIAADDYSCENDES